MSERQNPFLRTVRDELSFTTRSSAACPGYKPKDDYLPGGYYDSSFNRRHRIPEFAYGGIAHDEMIAQVAKYEPELISPLSELPNLIEPFITVAEAPPAGSASSSAEMAELRTEVRELRNQLDESNTQLRQMTREFDQLISVTSSGVTAKLKLSGRAPGDLTLLADAENSRARR